MRRSLALVLSERVADKLPAAVTCIALVFFGLQYAKHSRLAVLTGGGGWGEVFGWICLGLVAFLASYTIRKRWKILWPGSLESWLGWHTYLGVLALGLVLLHSNFRMGGIFAAGSFILLAATVINGLVGIVTFMVIPPLLSPLDTRRHVEDLPKEISDALSEIRRLVQSCPEPLHVVVERELLGQLTRPTAPWRKHKLPPTDELLRGAGLLPSDENAEALLPLVELATQVKDKQRQVALHRIAKLLEAVGLNTHVGLTTALLLLVAAHLFTVWYY